MSGAQGSCPHVPQILEHLLRRNPFLCFHKFFRQRSEIFLEQTNNLDHVRSFFDSLDRPLIANFVKKRIISSVKRYIFTKIL